MGGRTQGAICLGPMVNLQGCYAFLSLRIGRNITQSQFKELPTPPRVTRPVIAMFMHEKQQKGLLFKEHNGLDLPMTDEDGPSDGDSAAGVEIGNISNHPYMWNNPYRELVNDDGT